MVMEQRASAIRKHWFGLDSASSIAPDVLLMERNRLSQYQSALDWTTKSFRGVFEGITGAVSGREISILYSIGPAHIADCVEFLTAAFDIRQLVATGSVGGLSSKVGDVLLIDGCTTMDGYSLAHFESRTEEEWGRVVDIESLRGGEPAGRMFTVPSVSWETEERMKRLRDLGYIGVDLETGPFLAACKRRGVPGSCVHWVTDTPLDHDLYFLHEGDPEAAARQREEQHLRWLNLPKLILPRVIEMLRVD
jgi:uridine phosphorylase